MTYLVGGVSMELPIMLGAGVCKTVPALEPYNRSDLSVGALTVGSLTPEPREGNEGAVLQWPPDWESFQEEGLGLNSWGMPGTGFDQGLIDLSTFSPQKPTIVNIAGFSVNNYVEGVQKFDALDTVSADEINLGCPNAQEEKTIPIAYDLASMEAILDGIEQRRPVKPIWIKLSPYITERQKSQLGIDLYSFDYFRNFHHAPVVEENFLAEVLGLIARYSCITAVVFSNSLGNVVIVEQKTGKPVTSPFDGKAGMSGDPLRGIVLPLVKRARELLPVDIDVIGCGGVLKGEHVLQYLEAGASAVQCVSGPSWGSGPRFFQNLIQDSPELQDYLATHME